LGSASLLSHIGKQLYETRAEFMTTHDQGLTDTYNQLKDTACQDPEIQKLRKLHEKMDRAVLDAYGWKDIAVPAFVTPTTSDEKAALDRFEAAVIDRLFALNAERAQQEAQEGKESTSREIPLVSGPRKGPKSVHRPNKERAAPHATHTHSSKKRRVA
jgi:hypothetical protein